MHIFLVIIHVIAMMSSLALMSSAILMGLFGKRSAAAVATLAMYFTTAGGLSGAILLLAAPLTVQCALLTAYLVVTTAIYVFGFGTGYADTARFIRRSSSVQDR